jgi:hypothetical protein
VVFQRFSSFTGCTFNILTQPALTSGLPTVLTVIFVTITHGAQLNDHIKGVFINFNRGEEKTAQAYFPCRLERVYWLRADILSKIDSE